MEVICEILRAAGRSEFSISPSRTTLIWICDLKINTELMSSESTHFPSICKKQAIVVQIAREIYANAARFWHTPNTHRYQLIRAHSSLENLQANILFHSVINNSLYVHHIWPNVHVLRRKIWRERAPGREKKKWRKTDDEKKHKMYHERTNYIYTHT